MICCQFTGQPQYSPQCPPWSTWQKSSWTELLQPLFKPVFRKSGHRAPLGILHISNSLPSTCLSPNPTRAEVLVRTVPTQPHRGIRAKGATLTGLLPGREAVGILESHRGRPWVGEELGFLSGLKGAGKGGAEDGLQPPANSGTGGKNGVMPTRQGDQPPQLTED